MSVRFFYSAMAGFPGQAHDLGLTLLSVGRQLFRLDVSGGDDAAPFLDRSKARFGRNEVARGIEREVAIKSFQGARLDLGRQRVNGG